MFFSLNPEKKIAINLVSLAPLKTPVASCPEPTSEKSRKVIPAMSATPVPASAGKGPGTPVPLSADKGPGTPVPPNAAKGPGTPVPPNAAKGPGTPVPPKAAKGPDTPVPPSAGKGPGTGSDVLLSDTDLVVLHRAVLFLGKRDIAKLPRATWDEFQAGLSAKKQASISKQRLHKIVTQHKRLISIAQGGVQLCQLNHAFVQAYLQLAHNVEQMEMPQVASFSLSADSCEVAMVKNTILVQGLVGRWDSGGDGSVLFQFGGCEALRVKSLLPRTYQSGQMLTAVLSFRKDVTRICMRVADFFSFFVAPIISKNCSASYKYFFISVFKKC